MTSAPPEIFRRLFIRSLTEDAFAAKCEGPAWAWAPVAERLHAERLKRETA